jgi:hypothetical protein
MDGNPFTGDVQPHAVARYLRSPSRLSRLVQNDVGGMGASPAAILADVVTVLRADTARLAEEHDVDLDVQRMSEDRAAELIAGLVDGDGVALVEVFNDAAEQRDQVLREVLDDAEYRAFMQKKVDGMHTADPGTFGVLDDDQDEPGGEGKALAANGGEADADDAGEQGVGDGGE